MRRRWRIQPGLVTVAVIMVGVLLYGVGMPLMNYWLPSDGGGRESSYILLLEQIRLRTLQAFSVVWFFFLGGCIGSFLNVVIYRVPRGRTLMGSSYCPYCANPIRFQHNIPVIGWLLLRGRCYDCRLPISPRYPIVEALVGTVFFTLAVVELFSGGRNLPIRPPNHYFGVEWIVFDPQWDLIRLYAWHCWALCVLLSWAFMWYDRQRVPASYVLLICAMAGAAVLLDPKLEIVPWRVGYVISSQPRLEALFRALCGTGLGIVTGGFAWSMYRDPASEESTITAALRGAMSYALVGAAVGWQALLSVALLTPVMRLVLHAHFSRSLPRAAHSWPLALFAATWLHICIWKPLTLVPFWPSPDEPLYLSPIQWLIAIYCSALATYLLQPRPNEPLPDTKPSDCI